MKNSFTLAGRWQNDNGTFQFEIDEKESKAIVIKTSGYYPKLKEILYRETKYMTKIDFKQKAKT